MNNKTILPGNMDSTTKAQINNMMNKMNMGTIAKVKVVGIGGGGCNIIINMISSIVETNDIYVSDLIMMNTDCQSLYEPCDENFLKAHNINFQRVQLGNNGLGAGSDPEVGKTSAEYSKDEIEKSLMGADLIIICAGFGGGTGSGSAHVVAQIAKKLDILVIGIVTKPFLFEGNSKMKIALKAVDDFRKNADTTIVISNQLLFKVTTSYTMLKDAFKMVDNMFIMFLKCLMNMLSERGLINLDFADLTTTIKNKGDGVIGIGYCDEEEDMAEKAARKALANPLLENIAISSATNALVYITSNNMSLNDVEIVMNEVRQSLGPDVHIINGMSIVDKPSPFIKDSDHLFRDADGKNGQKWIMVTLVATGIIHDYSQQQSSLSQTQNISNNTQSLLNNSISLENEIKDVQIPVEAPKEPQKNSFFSILSSKFNKR